MTTGGIVIAAAIHLFAASATAGLITSTQGSHTDARPEAPARHHNRGEAELKPGIDSVGLGDAPASSLRTDSVPSPHDARIRAQINEVLRQSPDVRGYRVDVYVRQGTVYLQGRVGSPLEKRRAHELARGVPGVRRVVDSLLTPTRWTWDQDWRAGSAERTRQTSAHPRVR